MRHFVHKAQRDSKQVEEKLKSRGQSTSKEIFLSSLLVFFTDNDVNYLDL